MKRLLWCLEATLALVLAFFPLQAHAEDENLHFVDSRGATGYYVDTSTITVDSDHEYTADVIIIRADENLMFVYRTHFDYMTHTYQILTAKIMTYDTREIKASSDTPLDPATYAATSPMQAIVDFIYAWQKGLIKE